MIMTMKGKITMNEPLSYRTHLNGTLRKEDVGQHVRLVGWVQKKRNLGSLLFVDLRDRSGIVQLLFKDEINLPDIRSEYVLSVSGTVSLKAVANPSLATGEIEVIIDSVKVLNESEPPPIIIDEVTDAGEETRLKFRYLDLRRAPLQRALRLRSKVMTLFSQFFDTHDFVHVETPLLTLSTPGGARDFLVPSRLHKGAFYALPQSPQIYKQMLMIGGLERYYQFARCFRDEDLRADRQPDFTQVDVEMSFLTQDEFLSLMEQAIAKIFSETIGVQLTLPLAKITYAEAITRYGSDKPDLRYDLPIETLPDGLTKAIQQAGFHQDHARMIHFKKASTIISRKVVDEWTLFAKGLGAKVVFTVKKDQHQLQSSFAKFFPENMSLPIEEGDVLMVVLHPTLKPLLTLLGLIRQKAARLLALIPEKTYAVTWLIDTPLFELNDEGQLVSSHHPFTRPKDEHLHQLKNDPQSVLAQAFDLVINGYEVGGGSMRIYHRDIQHTIFELLGMSENDIQRKFGWFIDAFKYGTPPHGGIAFGLDRLVMILLGTENIKDVIAFPKNLQMVGPLEQTPNTVDESQLKAIHWKESE
jgi:aspartyl-tRNA synthetase